VVGYLFAYSVLYLSRTKIHSLVASVLYFGYMGFFSLAVFCMGGFIGLSATSLFNEVLYSALAWRP